jgi:hypothetical protein
MQQAEPGAGQTAALVMNSSVSFNAARPGRATISPSV